MKNFYLLLSLALFTSCGVSSSAVIKTVSIEKDCPKEKIKVLESTKGLGRGTYKVDACGKTYIYKVIGTTISEDGTNIKY